MKNKILHFVAIIVALGVGVFISFLLSDFFNSNISSQHNEKYWYFLNRGYPIASKGLSLETKQIPFPLIGINDYKIRGDRWIVIYHPIKSIFNVLLFSSPLLLFLLTKKSRHKNR